MAPAGLNFRGVISVALNVCACCILISMIVYLYTNLINGKGYVGITSISLAHRMGQHPTGKTYFSNALRKYGKDAFNVEIIDYAATKEELSEKERYWIAKLGTMAPAGYNLTTGGEGMYQLTAESCRKISMSKIGKPRPDIKPEDLTGQRFGRLTAIKLSSTRPARWLCVCDCGKEHNVSSIALKNSNTRSCGCMRREVLSDIKRTHGMTKSSIFHVWLHMKKNPNDVPVCERWLLFENFYSDMGDMPKGKFLMRRVNEEGYNHNNCYWGTSKDRSNMNPRTKLLEYGGKVQTQTEWSRELSIRHSRIPEAMKKGISF